MVRVSDASLVARTDTEDETRVHRAVADVLNEAGTRGWELVQVTIDQHGSLLLYDKPAYEWLRRTFHLRRQV